VAGDYPDRAAALRARDALPAGIRAADVWPRTFGSIQEMQRKR
jgi:septal ring-binding cell division protein DamX